MRARRVLGARRRLARDRARRIHAREVPPGGGRRDRRARACARVRGDLRATTAPMRSSVFSRKACSRSRIERSRRQRNSPQAKRPPARPHESLPAGSAAHGASRRCGGSPEPRPKTSSRRSSHESGHRRPHPLPHRGVVRPPAKARRTALHGEGRHGRLARDPPRRRAIHDAGAADVRLRPASCRRWTSTASTSASCRSPAPTATGAARR